VFKVGELVTTLDMRAGLVVQIKTKHYVQYCRVLFFGRPEPAWVSYESLREFC